MIIDTSRAVAAVAFFPTPKWMCHLLLDATNHAVPLGVLCADCGRRGGKGRGGGSHAGSGEEAAAAWDWERRCRPWFCRPSGVIARAKRVLTRDPPSPTKRNMNPQGSFLHSFKNRVCKMSIHVPGSIN